MDLGLHFWIGLQPTLDLSDHDRRLLERLRPAGVVLFRGNFQRDASYEEWTARLRRLLGDAREAIGRERILVGIDHEGGTVHRPPPPITHYSFAKEWAHQAGDVGKAMGVELRSLGINVDFAPVVDIHSNPDNPVIGPRSFGTTPEAVSAAAGDFLRGLQSTGVLGCPKHFPGHGDAAVDSHHAMPVLDLAPETLRERELAPYRALLTDTRLVMTAHILFPRLDDRPATLSEPILRGLLRDEIGFTGAVVTDDIGMGAVSKLFDDPDAAPRTLRAGGDLILICDYWTETERALAMAAHLEDALRRGTLDETVLEASRSRVETLLSEAPQHEVEILPEEVFAHHATLAPTRTAAAVSTRAAQSVSVAER
ncbi:MAG TPA: glycoside hydrolase family 3 protein [Thermoanaerobaculia bacterium]|nr:glycoside hydrolase family 3 protein [Thermoanaerobaculia bacterium]